MVRAALNRPPRVLNTRNGRLPNQFSQTLLRSRDRFSYCPSPGYPVGTGSPAITSLVLRGVSDGLC